MHKLALAPLVFMLGGCLGLAAPDHPHPDQPKGGAGDPNMNPDPGTQPPGSGMPSCGGMDFALSRVPPNVMLVLDRSGSMGDPIAAASSTAKWDDLKSALQSTVTSYDASVRFGVSLFSDPASADPDGCGAGKVDVAVGPSNGGKVLAQVNAQSPGGSTPTAASLAAIAATAMLNDPTRDNYVVLATDGQPNCADTDVVGKITALYNAKPPVKTFVIGVGDGTASDPQALDSWAVAGHTDRPGATKYYQVNSPADLKTAFDTIAGDVATCSFHMSQAAPDPSLLYVWSNMQSVPADPANGFTYDPATQTVTLHGASCDAIKANPSAKVQVVYGCASPPIG